MRQIVPIVIFGFDYNEDRTNVGIGTYMRCLEGVDIARQLFWKEDKDYLFVVSPGRASGVSETEQPMTMAEMMVNALRDALGEEPKVAVGETWGTRGEVHEASRIIQQKINEGLHISEACLVSNKLHLWRIGLYAERLKKASGLEWTWRYEACAWSVSSWGMRRRAQEMGSYLGELFHLGPPLRWVKTNVLKMTGP